MSEIRRDGTEVRAVLPIEGLQVRDAGAGDGSFTITGLAVVYGKRSLNLGGFYEVIEEGALTDVLASAPHVVSVWDHDTRYVLGSTKNKTHELREVDEGLRFWTRVAPTSYAADLRVLLERGDIDQCSFMFRIGKERLEYETDEDGNEIAVFYVERVSGLYDTTVCARGAYPQTEAQLAALQARKLAAEKASGRSLDAGSEEGGTGVAPAEGSAVSEVVAEPEPEPETAPVVEPDDILAQHTLALEQAKLRRARARKP